MSTSTIQQNILYGLREAVNVANSTWLTNALRWANAAYRQIYQRDRFKHLRKKTVFRTANGQQAYQAPDNFIGLCLLKDETNDNVLVQKTPEEFGLIDSSNKITDEDFTSDHDTAVSLDHNAILQYSETVSDDADHTTVYTRNTDYTINYTTGKITVLSTGAMSDATTYYIDYLYRTTGKPSIFCLEFDATNDKYVFRLNPCPDNIYIYSLLYPHAPNNLSASIEPLWERLEFCVEQGGIYFGSKEIFDDKGVWAENKQNYEIALQELIQMDQDLVPKNDRIPMMMRKTDHNDANLSTDRRTTKVHN